MDLEETIGRIALSRDNPMAVVTTIAGGERSGCLVGFVTQCSVHPPRWAVFLSKKNRTYEVARTADVLVVHLLGENDRDLAELFGGETGHEIDKFERCSWRPGTGGVPVLDGPDAWLAGGIVERVDAGDHEGFIIEVQAAELRGVQDQLGFQDAKSIEPGHEP